MQPALSPAHPLHALTPAATAAPPLLALAWLAALAGRADDVRIDASDEPPAVQAVLEELGAELAALAALTGMGSPRRPGCPAAREALAGPVAQMQAHGRTVTWTEQVRDGRRILAIGCAPLAG